MSCSNCSGSLETFRLRRVELKCAWCGPNFFFCSSLAVDFDSHHERLRMDAQFLCSDERMDTELVDKLVLQLNRIYPQILSDKEAHRVSTINIWECWVQWMGRAEAVPSAVFALVVQELERCHQRASGRAAETSLWEGWGGMWRILQRTSPSGRGRLH